MCVRKVFENTCVRARARLCACAYKFKSVYLGVKELCLSKAVSAGYSRA